MHMPISLSFLYFAMSQSNQAGPPSRLALLAACLLRSARSPRTRSRSPAFGPGPGPVLGSRCRPAAGAIYIVLGSGEPPHGIRNPPQSPCPLHIATSPDGPSDLTRPLRIPYACAYACVLSRTRRVLHSAPVQRASSCPRGPPPPTPPILLADLPEAELGGARSITTEGPRLSG